MEGDFTRDILMRYGVLTLTHNTIARQQEAVCASYRIVIPFNELWRESEKNREREVPDGEFASLHDEAFRDGDKACHGSRDERKAKEGVEASPSDDGCCAPNAVLSSGVESGEFCDITEGDLLESGPTITGTATEEDPHVCEVCGRPFRRRKDMRRHALTHSSEKPFSCPTCCVCFKSREYLQRHCRRVHDGEFVSHRDKNTDDYPPNPNNHPLNRPSHTAKGSGNTSPRRCDLPLKKRFRSASVWCPIGNGLSTPWPDTPPRPIPRINRSPIFIDVENDGKLSSQQSQGAQMSSPGRLSLLRSPVMVNSGRPKLVGGPFRCEMCSGLVARRFVMLVMPNPSLCGPGDRRPRIVCKSCFAKKTGLLCID